MFHQHRVELKRWVVSCSSNHKTLFTILWIVGFASVFIWQRNIVDSLLTFRRAPGRPMPRLRPFSFNISDFGAVGDGVTDNTAAFERAVSTIAKLGKRGGGQLNVPPGVWLTCPFNLTSHMTLYLAEDAVILGVDDEKKWPLMPPLPSYGYGREHPGPRYGSLIHGQNLRDVVITVPLEVCSSNEITKVDLTRNSIEELPGALSACSSLEVLLLSKNKIKDWPGEVLKLLPKLTCLKLDSNPLRQIPMNGFEAVSGLQILDLSGCVASLSGSTAFASLPHLQELYLRRVQLHEVPSDILKLQKLQILDLSQNSLCSIPEGFQNLSSLTELDLSDNNITSLPPELGLLEPSLQALRLDGNPLRSIRRTILDRGTKGVLKYLKDKI